MVQAHAEHRHIKALIRPRQILSPAMGDWCFPSETLVSLLNRRLAWLDATDFRPLCLKKPEQTARPAADIGNGLPRHRGEIKPTVHNRFQMLHNPAYGVVTALARLRGWSTSVPFQTAV